MLKDINILGVVGYRTLKVTIPAIYCNQNPTNLDVPMDNLLVVEVLEALQDLLCVVGDGALVVLQRTPLRPG